MKKTVTLFCIIIFLGITNAQQASDYFPPQTGFEWRYKIIPLDSLNNLEPSLAEFRIDSFATVGNYVGKPANIVTTKTGPLQTIFSQPYADSLFYYTEGSDGLEFFSISNIESFLSELDSSGIDPNFSFVTFFKSLQNWYPVYKFASNINSEYTLLSKDTIISTYNIRVQLTGTRLQDETIQTVLGDLSCKKFLTQLKFFTFFGPFPLELFSTKDSLWIAPGNWIVQDIIPSQTIDLTFLGVAPFTIYGREIKLTNELIPVELTSFSSTVNGRSVNLYWATATELNNLGFEIERWSEAIDWRKIAFVPGNGSTTQVHSYSYLDKDLGEGKYSYRLKQVDFDGTFEYSKIIDAEVLNHIDFELNQNYPNPFNPVTKISWQSPTSSYQTLKVYDILGNEVATLIDEFKPTGYYEVEFNADQEYPSAISSGVYYYRIQVGSFVQTRKMILLK